MKAQPPQADLASGRAAPLEEAAPSTLARPARLVTVIVPALDEAAGLERCLDAVARSSGGVAWEAVVADGGSADGTSNVARACGARVVTAPRGRAVQMNTGAGAARGDVLLFLHADTLLPEGALVAVTAALERPGVVGGCFRLRFAGDHRLLRLYGALARLPFHWAHYGDQAFFVRRDVFEAMGGYAPLPLMEDVDFYRRLSGRGRVIQLPLTVLTSARRFERNGVLRQQLRNLTLVTLYRLGVSPRRLASYYSPR